jgi:hypothetical protein
MRKVLLSLLLAISIVPIVAANADSSPAAAAEAPIDGKWINRDPSGNGMIVEFSAKSVTMTPVDATGKPTDDGVTDDVTYEAKNGAVMATLSPGNIMVAAFKDPNTIYLVVPGLPTTEYTRVK